MLSLAIDYKPYHSTVPMLDKDNILRVVRVGVRVTRNEPPPKPKYEIIPPEPEPPKEPSKFGRRYKYLKEGSLQQAAAKLGFNRNYFNAKARKGLTKACIWVGKLSVVEGYWKLVEADLACKKKLLADIELLQEKRKVADFGKWAAGSPYYIAPVLRRDIDLNKFSYYSLIRNRKLVRQLDQYIEEIL